MESTSTKMEAMRPVILKAGIPLVISVASFIFARMAIRKGSLSKPATSADDSQVHHLENHSPHMHRDEESFHRLDSASTSCQEVEDIRVECELEEEISGMRSRIRDLQERVWEQEARFIHYHDLKEREVMLMELQNKLLMEINSIELLEKEILSMEEDGKRIENMVIDFLKAMELLEMSRSENQLLHKRVKKLLRKMEGFSHLLKDKSVQIEAKEAEISRNHEELETKAAAIEKLEDEIKEMKMGIEQLQSEKHELLKKIDLAEQSALVKIDREMVSIDEYSKLVYELEQLKKDREAETKELIFLRWCHACLRHELMRRNNQEQHEETEVNNQLEVHYAETGDFGSDNELDSSSLRHGESCLGFPRSTGHVHGHSRRRKLIEKLKKWVDGSDKLKHEHNKLFRRHHVSKGADSVVVPARKSCSSA